MDEQKNVSDFGRLNNLLQQFYFYGMKEMSISEDFAKKIVPKELYSMFISFLTDVIFYLDKILFSNNLANGEKENPSLYVSGKIPDLSYPENINDIGLTILKYSLEKSCFEVIYQVFNEEVANEYLIVEIEDVFELCNIHKTFLDNECFDFNGIKIIGE